jgi:hypothetical protein
VLLFGPAGPADPFICNRAGEVTLNAYWAAHVLAIISVEIVATLAQRKHERKPVLVLAFLKSVLAAVQETIRVGLQAACSFIHRQSGLEDDPDLHALYAPERLQDMGVLLVSAAQSVGCITSTVVLLVVPKRKDSDESWEGDCLEPAFLYSSFMRATSRCIIMTHMLNRMPLPREGGCAAPRWNSESRLPDWSSSWRAAF